MEMEKEKQALSEDQVEDVTGGVNWKKYAKIGAGAVLGLGATAAGGKKFYDHMKEKNKEDDNAKIKATMPPPSIDDVD